MEKNESKMLNCKEKVTVSYKDFEEGKKDNFKALKEKLQHVDPTLRSIYEYEITQALQEKQLREDEQALSTF